jgi:hypothetical protein
MSLLGATILTAIATLALAVFAFTTAIFAFLAWLGQRKEIGDQATMLELQGTQLADQQATNAEQVKVLRLQAVELQESLDERKRQAEREHSYQARLVFLTEEPFGGRSSGQGSEQIRGIGTRLPSVTATAHNTSDQPVYDAEFRWHLGSAGHGEPNPEPIGTLLPGAAHTSTRDFPPGTKLQASGAVLRFRDAAGTVWIRRPDGGLTEQK